MDYISEIINNHIELSNNFNTDESNSGYILDI